MWNSYMHFVCCLEPVQNKTSRTAASWNGHLWYPHKAFKDTHTHTHSLVVAVMDTHMRFNIYIVLVQVGLYGASSVHIGYILGVIIINTRAARET